MTTVVDPQLNQADDKTDSASRVTYIDAINQALHQAMAQDERVIVIGEGVPDPKHIFESTRGLQETFGPQRVFDMPLSENGMTGVCIGAALTGMRPVMVHQRIDFALLAMDQLVNNAAKWRYMFAGQAHVPLVVRVIVGRGWGQGPQHSQGLQALFAHIPGLKVMLPATAADAGSMLLAAIADDDPVLFIEHRWLHHMQTTADQLESAQTPAGARVIRQGDGITIACFSYMLVEALKAADWLTQQGVDAEVIDMRWANPLDTVTVETSVKKTGHLLVADTGWEKGGLAQSLVAAVLPELFDSLQAAPAIVAMPNHPVPTSRALADYYYPGAEHIARKVLDMLDIDYQQQELQAELGRTEPRDQPDRDFTGPF